MVFGLMVFASSVGCMNIGADASSFGTNNASGSDPSIGQGVNENENSLQRAQNALRVHDVRGAQEIYDEILADADPGLNPNAAVGKALTDAMLLTDGPSVRKFLTTQLKAERPDFDTQRLVWAEGGMLSWFSSNVSWDRSSPSAVGVSTLVADELPWQLDRLDSWDAFVQPLQSTGNELVRDALLMNVALGAIENSLTVAINHPYFTFYYLPSEVLYGKDDASLGLVLGKVELLALRAALQGIRAGVELLAAYDHPWTVVKLTSEAYWSDVARDPSHPEHNPQLQDKYAYHAAYINSTFMRGMRDAESLERAARAAKGSIQDIQDAAELASTVGPNRFTFEWDKAEPTHLLAVRDSAQALVESFNGLTPIPNIEPQFSVNLGAFFTPDALVLDAQIPWVEVTRTGEPWSVTSKAEDTFTDRFTQGSLDGADWVVDGQNVELPISKPLAPWVDRLQDVYQGY